MSEGGAVNKSRRLSAGVTSHRNRRSSLALQVANPRAAARTKAKGSAELDGKPLSRDDESGARFHSGGNRDSVAASSGGTWRLDDGCSVPSLFLFHMPAFLLPFLCSSSGCFPWSPQAKDSWALPMAANSLRLRKNCYAFETATLLDSLS